MNSSNQKEDNLVEGVLLDPCDAAPVCEFFNNPIQELPINYSEKYCKQFTSEMKDLGIKLTLDVSSSIHIGAFEGIYIYKKLRDLIEDIVSDIELNTE